MTSVRFLLGLILAFAAAAASAQNYPSRSITMVVPLAAGGSADFVGRLLAQHMTENLGRPVVVENVSGAGGMIGASRVAKAAPDGYQILLGTVGTQAQNQTLYKQPLYDSTKDFEAIGLAVDVPLIMQVSNNFPGSTLAEVTAHIRANASRLNYGSPGAGSSNHLACALFNNAIGADVTHIPYTNAGQLFQDVISGRLDYWCPSLTAGMPMIQANQVKTIVTLSRERLESLPSVSTAHEAGLTNFEAGTWFALFGPKGTPAAVVQTLNAALGKVLEMPTVQARLRETGVVVVSRDRRSPGYLSQFVADEVKKWEGPIRATGVSM